MKDKILSEEPVSLPFVKEVLTKMAEKEELNFRAQKTLEHAETARLNVKQATSLITALEKLNIPRWKPIFSHKLVDTCPTTPEQVKTVLHCYNVTFSKEYLNSIASTIKEAKPKQ